MADGNYAVAWIDAETAPTATPRRRVGNAYNARALYPANLDSLSGGNTSRILVGAVNASPKELDTRAWGAAAAIAAAMITGGLVVGVFLHAWQATAVAISGALLWWAVGQFSPPVDDDD
jgi:hypothetical protein